MEAPLAEHTTTKLEDYISQDHLIGPNGSLTQQIAKELSLHWYCGDLREQEDNTNYSPESKRPFYDAINSG
jgi:putative ATPase